MADPRRSIPKREGVPHGHQPNTYDTSVSGANTFIGSQYLSALAAAERMALVMDDAESARRWRTVRQAGMKNQDEKLWNGEYYIQIPELASRPATTTRAAMPTNCSASGGPTCSTSAISIRRRGSRARWRRS